MPYLGTMKREWIESAGPPHLAIGGLRIWVHGRQFPENTDYWDGNWLNLTAHCGSAGAEVRISGSILHLGEVSRFLKMCEEAYDRLDGLAVLGGTEPNLRVQLSMESGGHMMVTVEITPDHMQQWHTFKFELDQTYLPGIIANCKTIIEAYPIVGRP